MTGTILCDGSLCHVQWFSQYPANNHQVFPLTSHQRKTIINNMFFNFLVDVLFFFTLHEMKVIGQHFVWWVFPTSSHVAQKKRRTFHPSHHQRCGWRSLKIMMCNWQRLIVSPDASKILSEVLRIICTYVGKSSWWLSRRLSCRPVANSVADWWLSRRHRSPKQVANAGCQKFSPACSWFRCGMLILFSDFLVIWLHRFKIFEVLDPMRVGSRWVWECCVCPSTLYYFTKAVIVG